MSVDLKEIEERRDRAEKDEFPEKVYGSAAYYIVTQDVPALLDEVKRLRGQLDAEHEGLKNILSTSVPKLESEIAKSAAINKALHEQLAAVTAERDAAVRHMKIIADTYRENVGDDGICGLCEYDAYHGIEGYANECPGFESNECFSWRGARKEQKHG